MLAIGQLDEIFGAVITVQCAWDDMVGFEIDSAQASPSGLPATFRIKTNSPSAPLLTSTARNPGAYVGTDLVSLKPLAAKQGSAIHQL
jgi:hypothetical protein